ncbi:hypothetical protein B0H14DRAFT_2198373, partial [Mycena olivaceomarginata]
DLWFQDCGLIIQAEDTIFCVSGAILAYNLRYFGVCFPFLHPGMQTRWTGVPLCCFQTPRGTRVLCFGFFDPFPVSTTVPILSSVLHMSQKYEADMLRKRALIHLSHVYPTTLDE